MEQMKPVDEKDSMQEAENAPLDASVGEEKSSMKVIVLVYGILVLVGVGTGYLMSRSGLGSTTAQSGKPGYIKTEKVAGVTDTKTFRDSAEGTVQKGGIDGEGTHKLIREGGESQTAYLVSSVVDMDEYVGKKVKVWGETFAAEKAAWLMDVGKIEVLQ